MKLAIILSLLVLCAATADAEIYKWTDSKGVVSYTDDLAQIPSRYRSKALKVDGIPSRQQEEKVLKDELTTPLKVTTPDSGQSTPAAAGMQQPPPAAVPLKNQPVPAPQGDQPIPPPLGEQSIPIPLGDQPAPVQ